MNFLQWKNMCQDFQIAIHTFVFTELFYILMQTNDWYQGNNSSDFKVMVLFRITFMDSNFSPNTNEIHTSILLFMPHYRCFIMIPSFGFYIQSWFQNNILHPKKTSSLRATIAIVSMKLWHYSEPIISTSFEVAYVINNNIHIDMHMISLKYQWII